MSGIVSLHDFFDMMWASEAIIGHDKNGRSQTMTFAIYAQVNRSFFVAKLEESFRLPIVL